MKQTKNLKRVLAIAFVAIFATTLLSMVSVTDKDPWKIPSKYKNMKNPTKPNKQNLTIAKTLYSKHCKSCHGKTGKGDGTKARELKTKMFGFASKELKKFNDGELYYMSFIGRDEMPAFDKKIKDKEDRWFVINYIKQLK